MTEMPTRPAPPVRYTEIEFGDTLQSIALRELGNASFWLDLVVLNGLRPPYIAAEASAGVLAYGEVLKLPAGVSGVSPEASPADLYGTDVTVDRDKLLPIEAGDFVLASGIPNLSAALARRIIVEKRELKFHPEFGCWVRSLLGKINGPTANQLAAFYVKSSLLEDTRVLEVPFCEAEMAGEQIRVSATVLPITGKPTDLKVLI